MARAVLRLRLPLGETISIETGAIVETPKPLQSGPLLDPGAVEVPEPAEQPEVSPGMVEVPASSETTPSKDQSPAQSNRGQDEGERKPRPFLFGRRRS